MLCCEIVIEITHDTLVQRHILATVCTVELQHQALLKIPCRNAGRLKSLNAPKNIKNLLLIGHHIAVYEQFILNFRNILAQETVLIERADDILPDNFFLGSKLQFAKLFEQCITKR